MSAETTQLENSEEILEEFRREKSKRIRVRVPRFQTSHAMTIGIDNTDARPRQDILILTTDLCHISQGKHPLDRLTRNYVELFQDSEWRRPELFTLPTESSTTTPLVTTRNVSSVKDAYLLQQTKNAKLYAIHGGRLLRCHDMEAHSKVFTQTSSATDRDEDCRDRAKSDKPARDRARRGPRRAGRTT